jgi:hypothetical protein
MIYKKDGIAKDLLTRFKVVNVHWEFSAESTWTLQFEDYPPIQYFDKFLETLE